MHKIVSFFVLKLMYIRRKNIAYRHSAAVVGEICVLLREEPALRVEVVLVREKISHDVQSSRQVNLTSDLYHTYTSIRGKNNVVCYSYIETIKQQPNKEIHDFKRYILVSN